MDWRVDPARDTPPWRQLVDSVLDAVASAELAPGDQLPSVRQMAAEALVNHNTVARAYRDLEQLGVVRGENGRGVFVQAGGPDVARALRRDETLDAFLRAAAEALRAGHALDDLLAALAQGRRLSA
ncbi:MAG: GntR family transcriptional regulator [Planctomycetes bacterium]|nr:GntR family transcriptional regulator [Planctomycetota bacterium]